MLRTPLLDNSDGGIQYNYYQYHYRVGEVAAFLQKGGCKRHAARYEQNYYREVLELLEKLRRKALLLFAAQQVFAVPAEPLLRLAGAQAPVRLAAELFNRFCGAHRIQVHIFAPFY